MLSLLSHDKEERSVCTPMKRVEGDPPYVAVKPTSNSITGENNNVAICCVREAQSSVSYRVSTENYRPILSQLVPPTFFPPSSSPFSFSSSFSSIEFAFHRNYFAIVKHNISPNC